MKQQSKEITTNEQYFKQIEYLENLARKGEKNLSAKEMKDMHVAAIAVEAYEDTYLMSEA